MNDSFSPTETVFDIPLNVPLAGMGEYSIVKMAAWVFAPPFALPDVSAEPPSPWVLAIPGSSYRGLAHYERLIPGSTDTAFSMAPLPCGARDRRCGC